MSGLISVSFERAEWLAERTRPDIDAEESAIKLAMRMGGFMENVADLISEQPSECAWGLLSIIADYLGPHRDNETGMHYHDVFVALQVAHNTAWKIGSPLWQAVIEMVRLTVWTELCVPLHDLQKATLQSNPLSRAHPSIDTTLRSV